MIKKFLFLFFLFALILTGVSLGIQNVNAQTSPYLSTVSVSPTGPLLMTGGTIQLNVTFKDQFGSNFYSSSTNTTYTSNNTYVATVNNNGLVTAFNPGTATITVNATNGIYTASGSSTVTVSNTAPNFSLTSTTITPTIFYLSTGGIEQLTVSNWNQNNLPISASTTYTSSNPFVATVNNNGLVTAVSPGTASITATSTDGIRTVSASSTVTVTQGTTTGFPAGCASALGYSVINGSPCNGTSSATTMVPGCSTALGYSVTTGIPCSGNSTVLQYLVGCSSIYGYSTVSGAPCNGTSIASILGTGGGTTPGLPTTGGNNSKALNLLLLASGIISILGITYIIQKYQTIKT
jgi:hypothetical protein